MRQSTLAPLVETQTRKSINISIQIVFATTSVPQVFPPCAVPPGCSVTLTGSNGTTGNLNAAFAGRYPEELTGNGRVVIAASLSPQDSVSYPVDNLNQIWAMGAATDGLIARITGTQVG